MRHLNARGIFDNKFPVTAGVLLVPLVTSFAASQTTNWIGNSSSVWTNPAAWTNNVPNAGSIAVIDGGTGTILALREGTLAGSVATRALLLRHQNYASIVAGSSVATLNFGSLAILDYSLGTFSASTFTLGTSAQPIRASITDHLALSTEGGRTLIFNVDVLSGSGSLTLSRGGSSGELAEIWLGDGADSAPASLSQFAGGVTVNVGVVLGIATDITREQEGSAVLKGPLGVG